MGVVPWSGGPEERVVGARVFGFSGDVIPSVEIQSAAAVRRRPIRIIQRPKRAGVCIARILAPAVPEAIGLFESVRIAFGAHRGPEDVEQLLIVLLPLQR